MAQFPALYVYHFLSLSPYNSETIDISSMIAHRAQKEGDQLIVCVRSVYLWLAVTSRQQQQQQQLSTRSWAADNSSRAAPMHIGQHAAASWVKVGDRKLQLSNRQLQISDRKHCGSGAQFFLNFNFAPNVLKIVPNGRFWAPNFVFLSVQCYA